MATQTDTFTVPASLEAVWKACEESVVGIGWKVASRFPQSQLVCKEPMGAYMLYTMPASIEIRLSATSPTATQVNMKGTNFDLGPIAGGHLKGKLNDIRLRIETLAKRY